MVLEKAAVVSLLTWMPIPLPSPTIVLWRAVTVSGFKGEAQR